MPLQWDITDIDNYQTLCWEKNDDPNRKENELYRLADITEALIHLRSWTGINKITSNNYKELTKRLAELELLGITYNTSINPREEDVFNHIGLKTNVDICDNKKWGNRIRSILREQAETLLNTF